MSEAITPALTAEEWQADRIERTDADGNVLVIVREKVMSLQEIPEGGSEARVTELAGGRAHAVAAIALNGKPFGFTHEMVNALDGICADYKAILGRSSGLHAVEGPGVIVTLEAVIARIVALLPPLEAR